MKTKKSLEMCAVETPTTSRMPTENVTTTKGAKIPLNNRLKVPTIGEMIKSISTIRHEWKLKSPFQKWCYFYGIGRAAFSIIRCPLFQENQALHWLSYYYFLFCGIYVMLVLYTAYYYTMIRENFSKCLPCTCFLSLVLALCPIFWCSISGNRYKYQSLLDFAGRYIYPDNREDTEFNAICSKQVDITVKSFAIKYLVMALAACAAVAGPIYVYITNEIKTSTTDLRIPFTEEGSNAEFIINLLYQFKFFLYGTLNYIGLEVMMSIFDNVMALAPELVRFELKKLSDKQKSKELSELQIHAYFKNIVKQALDTQNYIAALKEFLYGRNFVTPIVFTYGIGMSIYCQFALNYVAGYGMALMTYVQFFFICELGERIEENGFVDILYNSNWYTLPPKLQRDLMHLINRKQNGLKLTMGSFGIIINRQLFKTTTNNIYTLVMFLLNF